MAIFPDLLHFPHLGLPLSAPFGELLPAAILNLAAFERRRVWNSSLGLAPYVGIGPRGGDVAGLSPGASADAAHLDGRRRSLDFRPPSHSCRSRGGYHFDS